MSYEIIARSTDDARPVELYQLTYSGRRWYYTNAGLTMTVNGITYVPLAIEHDSVEQSDDVLSRGLKVRFGRDVGFADLFNPAPPSEIVMLTILATNYLVDNEFVVFWKGRVLNAEWIDEQKWLELTSQSNFSSLQQQGLRRVYSRNCPFVLYGNLCRASADAHRDSSAVLEINGLYVTIAAAQGKPDNYYAGGYVVWVNANQGNIEKRMIRASIGTTGQLYLSSYPIGLVGGAVIDAYPGCDHTIQVCKDKFNNADNYGGYPYIPTKNPFNGSSVY